jgi:hypothetical protein
MKRIIVLAIAMALAPAAAAQLYKYVDEKGKTVYSDQPPANTDSKQVNVPRGSGGAAAPAAAPKTAVERDKELDKSRKESREKADKQAKAAEKDQQAEQRCAAARERHAAFVEGGRIYKTNDKGERVFMDDAEIESGRERSRREMDEACKKP